MDAKPARHDPRDLASYTLSEAGLYLKLPVSTIRAWAFGQEYRTSGGVKKPAGLFRIAKTAPPTLSFWNLVEVYLLATIRRFHVDLHAPGAAVRLRAEDRLPRASRSVALSSGADCTKIRVNP